MGEPTHVSTSGNQSLIDHVFLSHPQQLKQCCVAPPLGTSDHNYINLNVTYRCGTTKYNKKSNRTIWRYQQADFDRANNLLNEVNWDELLEGDVDQMWYAWEEKFMSIMYQCIPTAKLLVKSSVPWLNRDITKAMRARNLAFRHVKRTRRSVHLNDYKKKRNKVANMIKDAKLKFFKGLNPSNPKNFWKVAKYLTKQTSSIPILKDCHGQAIHNDAAKATLLNDFFSGCFNDAQPPLSMSDYSNLHQPDPDLCPEQFLCTEDELLEMLLAITGHNQIKWARWYICYNAKTNSCEHCPRNRQAHEFVY